MSDTYIPLNLASLLKVTQDSDVDVSVSLGWMTIARIEEESGFWFVTVKGEKNPISSAGDSSVGAAVERLVDYLTPDR